MGDVSIRNVTKSYGDIEVIHGVDVDIKDGEFVVIVGPSGCGKSTLLRMVAGLESITGGEVSIDGRVVNNLEPMERNIAMVFQNYALYPHMSVFDNMAYGLKNRKVPKDEIKRKVGEVSEILELSGFLDRRPSQLSGGQRQRVAMGRAIVRNPKVFLFDEPLSNLDAKLRVSMRIEIKKLQRELGITTIYVTHDQVEAMTLADRLIAMNGGIAEQIGAPLDLYNTPQTQFVAGFIGSPPMNFLSATVAGDSVKLAGTDVVIPAGTGLNGTGNLALGIRPEDIDIAANGGGGLKATVAMIEPLGAETLVYVTLDQAIAKDGQLAIRRASTDNAAVGESVSLTFNPDRVFLFGDDGKVIART